jgi:hypothetical protein
MKPKILSWNVRWLNEGNKCLRIRNLLQDWKVDIVCFVKICRRGKEMEAAASLYYLSLFDLIQTTKYIG